MPDGPVQEARDELFLSQLGKELKAPFPSRWTCPEVQPWLYGYDAYEEVYKSLSECPFNPSDIEIETNSDVRPTGWAEALTYRVLHWFWSLIRRV